MTMALSTVYTCGLSLLGECDWEFQCDDGVIDCVGLRFEPLG